MEIEGRERKKKIDRDENDMEKTRLRESNRTRVEEILGEGDEIKTQEKERKQRKQKLGRGREQIPKR